mmetsp:Transcript_31180/g.56535  ORF Transcript_31180/g.56535 Transcript_31180/m.56535 type:complete len:261 (-) Transcript_31180:384-1166(-)
MEHGRVPCFAAKAAKDCHGSAPGSESCAQGVCSCTSPLVTASFSEGIFKWQRSNCCASSSVTRAILCWKQNEWGLRSTSNHSSVTIGTRTGTCTRTGKCMWNGATSSCHNSIPSTRIDADIGTNTCKIINGTESSITETTTSSPTALSNNVITSTIAIGSRTSTSAISTKSSTRSSKTSSSIIGSISTLPRTSYKSTISSTHSISNTSTNTSTASTISAFASRTCTCKCVFRSSAATRSVGYAAGFRARRFKRNRVEIRR